MSISLTTLKRVYFTVVEMFDVEDIDTLKSVLEGGHSRSLKMVSLETLILFHIFDFHGNYGPIFSRFNTINERDIQRGYRLQPRGKNIRPHPILASCKPGCKPGFRPGLQPGFWQVRAGLRHAFDTLSTFLSKTWSRTCCINLDISRLM